MKKMLTLLCVTFATLLALGQDPITAANKCYEDANYTCAAEQYRIALQQGKYAQKDKATILFRIGYALGADRKYDEAIKYLQQALQEKPGYGDAVWSMAGFYYSSGKYDEAKKSYTTAIDLYKGDNESLNKLYYWRGMVNATIEESEDALADFKSAIAIDSTQEIVLAAAADAANVQEEYEEAIDLLWQAVRHAGKDSMALTDDYYAIGMNHFALREYESAIAAYRESLRYLANNEQSAWGIADASYNLKKWNDAVAAYTRAIPMYKPDTASLLQLYRFRGKAYVNLKDYVKAEADFATMQKLSPNNGSASWERATMLVTQKKYKEAVPQYNKAIDQFKGVNESLDDLYYFRGYCYLQLKDTAQARADFLQSLKLNANLRDPNVEMGNISFFNGQYEEAKKYFDKGVPGFTTDSARLSGIYFRKGLTSLLLNAAGGTEDLLTSLKYDSTNKYAHQYLGEVYYNSKQYAAAASEMTKSIALFKADKDSLPKLYSYRGAIYSANGQYDKALADYEQASKLKPGEVEYVVGIGRLAFELKAYQKVIDAFTKSITLYKPAQKNELAFVYYGRGRSYFELNNKPKAKADFTKALQLVPTYTEAQTWLDKCNQP